MARSMNFEFNCPQFYDFCNDVEDNTTDIHCLGGDSPSFESKFNLKSKNLMKNRFAAWNSKLSTPVNRSPFVNTHRQNNTTDSEKLNERKKRLSKSEGSVNVVGASVNIFKKEYHLGFACKKSLSENDLRPKKKFPVTPKKAPATPMCLKRTLGKNVAKKLKTTEELELEKIAELQRLTLKHLRLNEKNLQRMKLKPKPLSIPKKDPLKEEKKGKAAAVKEFQRDLKAVVKRMNSNRNMKNRFVVSNQTKRANRLDAVSSYCDLELGNSTNALQLPLSDLLNEVQVSVDEKDILNELSFKKCPGHSGLSFHLNNSKNAALKPFNFHDKVNNSGPEPFSKSSLKVNKENEMVTKVQFSHSFRTSHLGNPNEKENFCWKMAPKTDVGIRKQPFKFW